MQTVSFWFLAGPRITWYRDKTWLSTVVREGNRNGLRVVTIYQEVYSKGVFSTSLNTRRTTRECEEVDSADERWLSHTYPKLACPI